MNNFDQSRLSGYDFRRKRHRETLTDLDSAAALQVRQFTQCLLYFILQSWVWVKRKRCFELFQGLCSLSNRNVTHRKMIVNQGYVRQGDDRLFQKRDRIYIVISAIADPAERVLKLRYLRFSQAGCESLRPLQTCFVVAMIGKQTC